MRRHTDRIPRPLARRRTLNRSNHGSNRHGTRPQRDRVSLIIRKHRQRQTESVTRPRHLRDVLRIRRKHHPKILGSRKQTLNLDRVARIDPMGNTWRSNNRRTNRAPIPCREYVARRMPTERRTGNTARPLLTLGMTDTRHQRRNNSRLSRAFFQMLKVRKVDRSTPSKWRVQVLKVRRVAINTRRRCRVT